MIEQLEFFTYDVYIDFLKLIQSKYKIITFSEVSETSHPYLILRHDIDASLDAALKMAKIEKGMNVNSTYFVLFSHKIYNLLETESLNTLRKICDLGHDIGLHYDLEVYDNYNRNLKETLEGEVRLLDRLLNRKVTSIVCHNPSTLKGGDPLKDITNYINATNPSLYDLYVSESCRAWHMDDLRRLLEFGHERVQLLIHPFLWTKKLCGREEVLEDYFDIIRYKNEGYKNRWIKLWSKHLRSRSILR